MPINPVQPNVQNQPLTTQKKDDKKQVGTGFTNINRVLEANRANKLGSSISGNIKQQAGQVRTGIMDQSQEFQKQAGANRLDTEANKQLREQTLGGITGQSGFQDPDAKTVEAFQQMRGGEYKGPTGLDEQQTSALKRQGADIASLGNLTGTSSGKQTLLQRIVGAPQYTSGQQKMDSLLLGQSGKDLHSLRRETKNLESGLGAAQTNAANLAQQYKNRAAEFGRETSDLTNKALLGQETNVQSAYNAAKTAAQQQYEALQQKLKDVDASTDVSQRKMLSEEDFKSMGIDTSTPEGQKQAGELSLLFGLSNRELVDSYDISTQKSKGRGFDYGYLEGRGGGQVIEDMFNKVKHGQLTSEMKQKLGIDPNTYAQIAEVRKKIGQDVDWAGNGLLKSDYQDKTIEQVSSKDDLRRINALRQLSGNTDKGLYGSDILEKAGQKFTNKYDANRALQQLTGVTLNPYTGGLSFNDEAKTRYGSYIPSTIEKLRNLPGMKITEQLANAPAIGESLALGVKQANSFFEKIFGVDSPLQIDVLTQTLANTAGDAVNLTQSIYDGSLLGGGGLFGDIFKFSDKNLKKDIKPGKDEIQDFLDNLEAYKYSYKNPEHGEGEQLGVMAQDLEKSDLGKESVKEVSEGKIVNYSSLLPTITAAMAQMNERLKKIEK